MTEIEQSQLMNRALKVVSQALASSDFQHSLESTDVIRSPWERIADIFLLVCSMMGPRVM